MPKAVSAAPSPLWKSWLRIARARPESPALIDASTGAVKTFDDLTRTALSLATELAKASGCLVAFCLPNSFEWIEIFLALQAVGAGAMPLDAATPDDTRPKLAASLKASYYWNGHQLLPIRSRKKRLPNICCVKITSGSTGTPAALPCQAGHLIADGRNVIATMAVRKSDRNLGLIPFGFSYGLGNLVMPLLLQGTPLVFAHAFLPAQIPEWISRHGVTVFPSVPAVFHILAQLPGRAKLTPLRTAISAGSVLSPEVARRFHERFGIKLHNFYGASETGGICYDRTGTASLSGRSIGSPLKNVAVRVLAGGRIEVRSKAVLFPAGKHRLRDIGEWTDRKELRLLSRLQPVANIGGRKVHPSEIEALLRGHPSVGEARVLVDNSHRDTLVAIVESPVPLVDIQRYLRRRLPEWKIPRRIIVKPQLPRTDRGKLDLAGL